MGSSADETIQRNAHAIGAVEMLEILQEINYEEMIEKIYEK